MAHLRTTININQASLVVYNMRVNTQTNQNIFVKLSNIHAYTVNM